VHPETSVKSTSSYGADSFNYQSSSKLGSNMPPSPNTLHMSIQRIGGNVKTSTFGECERMLKVSLCLGTRDEVEKADQS